MEYHSLSYEEKLHFRNMSYQIANTLSNAYFSDLKVFLYMQYLKMLTIIYIVLLFNNILFGHSIRKKSPPILNLYREAMV